MSVTKLNDDLIKKDDVVYASKINTLFRKLEEIRAYHSRNNGFRAVKGSGGYTTTNQQSLWEMLFFGPTYTYHPPTIEYGEDNTPDPFDTTIASIGEEVTPEYAQTLKEYVTLLENSKYIGKKYHNQITIPRTNDYIQAQEILLSHIKTINELAAIDANCGSDYDSYCQHCGSNRPAGNSNDWGCGDSGGCSGDDYTNGWNQSDNACLARSS